MTDERPWLGKLNGRRKVTNPIPLAAWTNESPGFGGSRPLLAIAADGQQYWVKLITNDQGPMVPVNEQIVGRCGELIGAPTCQVEIIDVPASLAGLVSGIQVEAGLAHGSLNVPRTVNNHELGHRTEDDNSRRHAGIFALHDWCWGGDCQWLFAQTDEQKTYSHDHGHFFPGGPNWQQHPNSLRDLINQPHPLHEYGSFSAAGLSPEALEDYAVALDAVSSDDIIEILSAIPPEWDVTDADLENLGFFLEQRAPRVATRLRQLTGRIE